MKRFLLVALFALPAHAQDRPLEKPRIKANGAVELAPGFEIGRWQNNKFTSQPDKVELKGSGSTGDASQLATKPEVDGGQLYALGERQGDEVEVMAFIPPTLRPAIRDYTSTADLTPYLRKAQATGKRMKYAAGRYPVCDSLPLASGQEVTGPGVVAAYLWVGSCFNMSASAVVPVAAGDSSGWDGVGIRFDQAGATSRATLRQYPWALDISAATRFKMGRIRLSAAWNGIKCQGNCGGFDGKLIEVGAFNKGALFDGALDFVHWDVFHAWPFDFGGNPNLMAIYLDGFTIGAEIGVVDGLDAQTINTFGPLIISNANGNDGAARQVGMMQLDGDNSRFENLGGDWQIGLLSTTKSGAKAIPAVTSSTGIVTISSLRTWGDNNGPFLTVTGGICTVSGGSIEMNGDHTAIEVSGGKLNLLGTTLYPLVGSEGPARTTPFVRQTGSGVLVAKGNVAGLTANGGGGNLFSIENADFGTVVADNVMARWGIAVQSGTVLGTYEGNIRPASAYVSGVAVGREYSRRLTGTLNANGEATVPHGIIVDQGVAPAERIFSISASAFVPGGAHYLYPVSQGSAWDGANVFLKTPGAGYAGLSFEVTVRYR